MSFGNLFPIQLRCVSRVILIIIYLKYVESFWDHGTTTPLPASPDRAARESFFRWQKVESNYMYFFGDWNWEDNQNARKLNCVAGISIDFLPLGTAIILNRRVLLSSANYLDMYKDRERDLRVWALGRGGLHNTPYRYRVWRIQRVLPRSLNPEHQHGPFGYHSPRHDLAVIHTLDQIYIMSSMPTRNHYAYRGFLPSKYQVLKEEKLVMHGSGFKDLVHIAENYDIMYHVLLRQDIVDCSIYLPKWWGKFICIKNRAPLAGVPSGGGLLNGDHVFGIGCFEIRYNEDRVLVFTDLRYYVDQIQIAANTFPGMYYEYAYPQWGVSLGLFSDGGVGTKIIPKQNMMYDLYPLGK